MRIQVRIQVQDHEAEIEVEVEQNGLPTNRADFMIDKLARQAVAKASAAVMA